MKRKQSTPNLGLFITAGFPDLNSLERQLRDLDKESIAFVEIGMPFSDPLADGPIIQQTSQIALQNGMSLNVLFQQLKQIETITPRILMGYANPVLQFGIERFLNEAKSCNIHHVILPDLPVEVYEKKYKGYFDVAGITPCFLITPDTDDERVEKAAELSKNGFVYLVSNNSTTGGDDVDFGAMNERYRKIKALCGLTPVYVGFGIRDRQSFDQATEELDGGIIGSAYLLALEKSSNNSFLSDFFNG